MVLDIIRVSFASIALGGIYMPYMCTMYHDQCSILQKKLREEPEIGTALSGGIAGESLFIPPRFFIHFPTDFDELNAELCDFAVQVQSPQRLCVPWTF